MSGQPYCAVGPITLTAILYPQPAVDIRYLCRLPKNSDAMKLKRIFENLAIFNRRKLFKLVLHLKMEISVSEPCDVIRVI